MTPRNMIFAENPVLNDDRLPKTLRRLMRTRSFYKASDELFSLEFALIELITSLQLDAEQDPIQYVLVDELWFLLQTLRELENTPFYHYGPAYSKFVDHLTAFCRDYVVDNDKHGSTSFQLVRNGKTAVFREIHAY